jgi:hypothetical protein
MKSEGAVVTNYLLELCLGLTYLTLPNTSYVVKDFYALSGFLKNSPKTKDKIKILYTYRWQSKHLKLEMAILLST